MQCNPDFYSGIRLYYFKQNMMAEKIVKTPKQVAAQLERQFLMYFKEKPFDVFSLFSFEKHSGILNNILLEPFEIPVLVLKAADDNYIINTTLRFVRIGPMSHESVYYKDFRGHAAYKSMLHGARSGYFEEFGLRKLDGELIYWSIPTGKPGYGFWYITNRCSIIGRRILIIP
jgi:hypothetical protein